MPPLNDSHVAISLTSDALKTPIEDARFLLENASQWVTFSATALIAYMAIIWAGEIWRKRHPTDRASYRATTMSSIRMIVAFVVLAVGTVVWLAVPFYRLLVKLKALVR